MRYFQKLKLVIFLKKILKIVVKRYGYTSYLHFTTSIGSTTKFLSLNVTINDQNSLFLINNSDDDEALDGFNSDGHLDTIPSIADEQTHYQNP
jgi:hypothetical protein